MPRKSSISRTQFVQLCACGCNQPTLLAAQTDRASSVVVDHPQRYIFGHSSGTPESRERNRLRREGIRERAKEKEEVDRQPDYLVDEKGCWVWQKGLWPNGYGYTKKTYAHIVYYRRAKGNIPQGMEIDHTCRNHACVNPDHLEAVTHAVNVRRGKVAKLTAADVLAIRASDWGKRGAQARLARQYSVSSDQISKIVHGKVWRDIAA